MYCWKCGKKLFDDAKFCFACGTKVELPEQGEEKSITTNPKLSSVEHNKPAKSIPEYGKMNIDRDNTSHGNKEAVASSLKTFPEYPKPRFRSYFLSTIFISGLLILLGVTSVNQNEYLREESMRHGNGDPHFYGVIFLLIGAAVFIGIWVLYSKQFKRHRLSVNNPAQYAALREKELKEAQENQKRRQALEAQRLATLPACPICGKKNNVKRISTTDRSLSIAMMGLASSKIGKQYECTACKHKW